LTNNQINVTLHLVLEVVQIMPINESNINQNHPPDAFPNFFTRKDNSIAIYTAMRILRSMKKELGIEAMHEYLDGYVRTVDQHNPKLSLAVTKALSLMSVEKIYKDACCGDHKQM